MAARVKRSTPDSAESCAEPTCSQTATFTVCHRATIYAFCTEHVWARMHAWLGKLAPGEVVTVAKTPAEPTPNPG